MSRATLPGHRSRWRTVAAGLAIATVSFTTVACGGEEGGIGVVEDGGGGSEEQEEDGGENLDGDGNEQGDDD